MRTVIQRVRNASVSVPDEDYRAEIGTGLLVLAAFVDEDTEEDLEWMARTENDDSVIPEKTIVVIREIEGVKLIVEEEKEG